MEKSSLDYKKRKEMVLWVTKNSYSMACDEPVIAAYLKGSLIERYVIVSFLSILICVNRKMLSNLRSLQKKHRVHNVEY